MKIAPKQILASKFKHLTARTSATLVLIMIAAMPTCYASDRQTANSRVPERPAGTDLSRQELERLVESFGPDEEDGALRRLLSIPRSKLISDLVQLRKEKRNNDALEVRIAFLLCRLGYDYRRNRRLIRSNLSKARRSNADTTISLIGALIARGDRGLLSDLFSACAWSDGAASGAISDVFLEETRRHPSAFLRTFKLRSLNVRLAVYRFLKSAWTKEELSDLRKSLRAVPQAADVRDIRIEFLRALDN